MEKTTYLGDGVYCKKDDNGFILMANNHLYPTDEIYLEDEVINNFIKFVNECRQKENT